MTSDGEFVVIDVDTRKISTAMADIDFDIFSLVRGYFERVEESFYDGKEFRLTVDAVRFKGCESPGKDMFMRKFLAEKGIICGDSNGKFERYYLQYEEFLYHNLIREYVEAREFCKVDGKIIQAKDRARVYLKVDDMFQGNPYANMFIFCLFHEMIGFYHEDKKYIILPKFHFYFCESSNRSRNDAIEDVINDMEINGIVEFKDFWERELL